MVPQALEDTLTALQKQGGKMPRVLYTVPVGQNPTGEQGHSHADLTVSIWLLFTLSCA